MKRNKGKIVRIISGRDGKHMRNSRAQEIASDYQGNTWFIKELSKGLSLEESLLHPEFPTNCFNWVLGHVVWRRSVALEVLGEEPFWRPETCVIYKTGSEPLSDRAKARDLSHLIQDLGATESQITNVLMEMSEEELDRKVETDRGEKSRWEHLAGLHWHETFHMGQLELLRSFMDSRREQ
jgi:hypothetical protein